MRLPRRRLGQSRNSLAEAIVRGCLPRFDDKDCGPATLMYRQHAPCRDVCLMIYCILRDNLIGFEEYLIVNKSVSCSYCITRTGAGYFGGEKFSN